MCGAYWPARSVTPVKLLAAAEADAARMNRNSVGRSFGTVEKLTNGVPFVIPGTPKEKPLGFRIVAPWKPTKNARPLMTVMPETFASVIGTTKEFRLRL